MGPIGVETILVEPSGDHDGVSRGLLFRQKSSTGNRVIEFNIGDSKIMGNVQVTTTEGQGITANLSEKTSFVVMNRNSRDEFFICAHQKRIRGPIQLFTEMQTSRGE